jgi:hypothetical protein
MPRPLLPDPEVYEQWLEKRGISWRQIESGEPCLPVNRDGEIEKIALSIRDVERFIAREDPVYWAFLNLQEKEGVRNPEHPLEWWVMPGDAWDLFDFQKRLARLTGDLVVECGSEVGKTRDIVLGSLWEADTARGGDGSLIAADSDTTLEEIWEELVYQTEKNHRIGRGVKRVKIKPFRTMDFHTGFRLQLRICGHDGQQFRGAHITRTVRADEVAKWKNPQQLNELYRAVKPGAHIRLYSTPDGDYSSPFYAICHDAVSIDHRETFDAREKPTAGVGLGDRKLKKINITKKDLPYPFWSAERAEKYRVEYKGEHSLGWVTNVLGAWGSPQKSVFPWPLLKPLLKYLPHYRVARVIVNEDDDTYDLTCAMLDPEQANVEREPELGSALEEIIERDRVAMVGDTPAENATQVARHIASLFPDITDWQDPVLFCGGDVGTTEPTELLFQRVIGDIWKDVFRLHLQYAPWPMVTCIVQHLDHVTKHRVKWGIDNGSAGSYLVAALCEETSKAECPVCQENVIWSERLRGRGFGEAVDEIDPETGALVLNPDREDKNGVNLPFRWLNKEFSTRILERKAHNRQMEMAHDGGAGDQKQSGPQLLTNHTVTGFSKKGERSFKDKDDHHIDARRQAALAIVEELRKPEGPPLNAETMRTTGMRESYRTFGDIGVAAGPAVRGIGDFGGIGGGQPRGRTGVRGGLW